MSYYVAEIAVENTAYSFDLLYSYLIPDKFLNKAKEGSRVIIQFGNIPKKRQGIIFSIKESEKAGKLKSIIDMPDEAPILNDEALCLAKWLKETTFCTYYDAIKVQLPSGINMKIKTSYLSVSDCQYEFQNELEKKIFDFLEEKVVYVPEAELFQSLNINAKSKELKNLLNAGKVIRNYDTSRTVGDASHKIVRSNIDKESLAEISENLTDKQKEIMNVLCEIGIASVKEVCYYTGYTAAVLKALEKKELITVSDVPKYRRPQVKLVDKDGRKLITLTEEQQTAYDNLVNKYDSGGGVSLLFGVTGSGKTSVYIKLIDYVLSQNRGVIVMVPEIALTPKLVSAFQGRYKDKVAIFHSGLSVGERYDEWKRIKNKDACIAVGTRSAVFAPLDNIGLIIMDEEHEHTYKSEQNPKFHAREVSKFRAKYHKALLVLSSATPDVTTYAMAVKGRYGLETLKHRYKGAVLPNVITVDMRKEQRLGNFSSISSELLKRLEENLKNGFQSILLINRRGFNTFASCDYCNTVRTCPSCSVSLSYHADNERLMCHNCGYSEPMDNYCPTCGKKAVRFSGTGTQKIEEELSHLLPKARVVRMDTDSTMSRYSHEDKLKAFSDGEFDILLGTQMVAKGLDFENVTLVGVVSTDAELFAGDYLSSERAFDLLTQVVGRAGRGKNKGLAIIQTTQPDSSVIRLAKAQNYEDFFNTEIGIRKYMTYPPYCDICSITFSDEEYYKAIGSARCFLYGIEQGTKMKYTDLKVIAIGPFEPKIGKANGKFRVRIIVKCINNARFRSLMGELLDRYFSNKELKYTQISVDINPVSLV